MLGHRPEPGAIAVELEVPPVVSAVAAVQREAGRKHLKVGHRVTLSGSLNDAGHLVSPGDQDARAPVEEATRRFDSAGGRHPVGDEGAIPEPAIPPVRGERGARRVGARGILELQDEAYARLREFRELIAFGLAKEAGGLGHSCGAPISRVQWPRTIVGVPRPAGPGTRARSAERLLLA